MSTWTDAWRYVNCLPGSIVCAVSAAHELFSSLCVHVSERTRACGVCSAATLGRQVNRSVIDTLTSPTQAAIRHAKPTNTDRHRGRPTCHPRHKEDMARPKEWLDSEDIARPKAWPEGMAGFWVFCVCVPCAFSGAKPIAVRMAQWGSDWNCLAGGPSFDGDLALGAALLYNPLSSTMPTLI